MSGRLWTLSRRFLTISTLSRSRRLLGISTLSRRFLTLRRRLLTWCRRLLSLSRRLLSLGGWFLTVLLWFRLSLLWAIFSLGLRCSGFFASISSRLGTLCWLPTLSRLATLSRLGTGLSLDSGRLFRCGSCGSCRLGSFFGFATSLSLGSDWLLCWGTCSLGSLVRSSTCHRLGSSRLLGSSYSCTSCLCLSSDRLLRRDSYGLSTFSWTSSGLSLCSRWLFSCSACRRRSLGCRLCRCALFCLSCGRLLCSRLGRWFGLSFSWSFLDWLCVSKRFILQRKRGAALGQHAHQGADREERDKEHPSHSQYNY